MRHIVRRVFRGRDRALASTAAALLLAPLLGLGAAAPAQAATHDPILFVHGYGGDAWNWDDMRLDFIAAGWSADRLEAMSYNSVQSNEITAAEVRDEVDALRARTGAAKVDIVSHSMGAMNSRWYLKFLGGTDVVDDWVSIGGANGGTVFWAGCWAITACGELNPNGPFLTQLNSGDLTPGAVNYTAIWSECDEAITPNSRAQLAGATNWNAGCVGHVTLLNQDAVAVRVQQAVA